MTTKQNFRNLMRVRREYTPGTMAHGYISQTCRKLAWIIRGVPVNQWRD